MAAGAQSVCSNPQLQVTQHTRNTRQTRSHRCRYRHGRRRCLEPCRRAACRRRHWSRALGNVYGTGTGAALCGDSAPLLGPGSGLASPAHPGCCVGRAWRCRTRRRLRRVAAVAAGGSRRRRNLPRPRVAPSATRVGPGADRDQASTGGVHQGEEAGSALWTPAASPPPSDIAMCCRRRLFSPPCRIASLPPQHQQSRWLVFIDDLLRGVPTANPGHPDGHGDVAHRHRGSPAHGSDAAARARRERGSSSGAPQPVAGTSPRNRDLLDDLLFTLISILIDAGAVRARARHAPEPVVVRATSDRSTSLAIHPHRTPRLHASRRRPAPLVGGARRPLQTVLTSSLESVDNQSANRRLSVTQIALQPLSPVRARDGAASRPRSLPGAGSVSVTTPLPRHSWTLPTSL